MFLGRRRGRFAGGARACASVSSLALEIVSDREALTAGLFYVFREKKGALRWGRTCVRLGKLACARHFCLTAGHATANCFEAVRGYARAHRNRGRFAGGAHSCASVSSLTLDFFDYREARTAEFFKIHIENHAALTAGRVRQNFLKTTSKTTLRREERLLSSFARTRGKRQGSAAGKRGRNGDFVSRFLLIAVEKCGGNGYIDRISFFRPTNNH